MKLLYLVRADRPGRLSPVFRWDPRVLELLELPPYRQRRLLPFLPIAPQRRPLPIVHRVPGDLFNLTMLD